MNRILIEIKEIIEKNIHTDLAVSAEKINEFKENQKNYRAIKA